MRKESAATIRTPTNTPNELYRIGFRDSSEIKFITEIKMTIQISFIKHVIKSRLRTELNPKHGLIHFHFKMVLFSIMEIEVR